MNVYPSEMNGGSGFDTEKSSESDVPEVCRPSASVYDTLHVALWVDAFWKVKSADADEPGVPVTVAVMSVSAIEMSADIGAPAAMSLPDTSFVGNWTVTVAVRPSVVTERMASSGAAGSTLVTVSSEM